MTSYPPRRSIHNPPEIHPISPPRRAETATRVPGHSSSRSRFRSLLRRHGSTILCRPQVKVTPSTPLSLPRPIAGDDHGTFIGHQSPLREDHEAVGQGPPREVENAVLREDVGASLEDFLPNTVGSHAKETVSYTHLTLP